MKSVPANLEKLEDDEGLGFWCSLFVGLLNSVCCFFVYLFVCLVFLELVKCVKHMAV